MKESILKVKMGINSFLVEREIKPYFSWNRIIHHFSDHRCTESMHYIASIQIMPS